MKKNLPNILYLLATHYCWLLLLITMTTARLYAQSTGQLSGFVRDARTDELLIGVSVLVEGTSSGSITDVKGFYAIKGVTAGSYNVTASYVGYQPLTRYNVVVRSGGNPETDFLLKEATDELSEVVVTASPFEKLDETPNSIQRLSQEEIATYPGGNNDIAKVVQSLPGVSGSVGFRNDVIIRGGAPNENVYYLDGVEIPNINHFATQGSAGGPVGLLNVSFINNVTLSTSAFPARYDNVLSGVLQFDQRDGDPQQRHVNFRLSASEAAITLDGPLITPRVDKPRVQYPLGDTPNVETNITDSLANTTFIVSVRRSYLQFLFKLIGLPFLPDYWDYQYKVNHKIDTYNDVYLTGIGSLDNFKINPPEEATEEQQALLEQVPIIRQWTSTIGVGWRNRFRNNKGFMRTVLSGNILNNTFDRYTDNENKQGLLFTNNSVEDENKLRYELTNFAGQWTISSGFLAQYSRYTNTTKDVVNEIDYSTHLTFFRYGIFSQVSRPLLRQRLTSSFGIRADGNTFTARGNNMLRTLSPRLALSYTLAPRWNINTSAGIYYKIPPYTVLGYKDNLGNYANRDSRYIRSDHLVAGLEFLPTRSFRITLEGFYKKYHHYPVSVAKGVSLANLGGNFEVLGNEDISSVGLGRTYGIELLLQQKLARNFYGILAYTYYFSAYTGLNTEKYIPSVWDNRHLLTFTGGYKLPKNWEIGLRVRYLGATPYAQANFEASAQSYPIVVIDYGTLGDDRLKPYNQTDLRIDKKWNFTQWTFNVFLEIQNILGNDLPSAPSYALKRGDDGMPAAPRQLEEVMSANNSGTIPTLGIVIDF